MYRLMILFLFISFNSFSEINAYGHPTYGFMVDRARNTKSVTVPIIEGNDKDPSFPYWGASCQLPLDHLCINSSPITYVEIPNDTKKIKLHYYTSSGYNDGVLTSSNGTYNIRIGTLHYDSTRYYKLLLPFDKYKLTTTCTESFNTSVGSDDKTFSSAVIFVNKRASSSCYILIDGFSISGNNNKFGLRTVGVRFGYDTDIYSKISSGTYIARVRVRDSFGVSYLNENNVNSEVKQFSAFTNYVFSLKVKGYLDYKLISPRSQNITFNRKFDIVKYFVFNGYIKSNGSGVELRIKCQYERNKRCELRNNEGYSITVKPGLRFDHLSGPHPEIYFEPDELIDVLRFPGYKNDKDFPLSLLFEIDSNSIHGLPNQNLYDFKGNITLILDANFL